MLSMSYITSSENDRTVDQVYWIYFLNLIRLHLDLALYIKDVDGQSEKTKNRT